jgi:hypothetical protein
MILFPLFDNALIQNLMSKGHFIVHKQKTDC